MEQNPQEVEYFLSENPTDSPKELKLRKDVVERIQDWTTKGFGTQEEKEKLINSVPRKANINLIAPVLNEEIAVDLHPKM